MKKTQMLLGALLLATVFSYRASAQGLGQSKITTRVQSHMSQGSCSSADMKTQGTHFWRVNDQGIPAYTTEYHPGISGRVDAYAEWESDFNSSKMNTGVNTFYFGVCTISEYADECDSDHCTDSSYQPVLYNQNLGEYLLFGPYFLDGIVRRQGTSFQGYVEVVLSLEELAPEVGEYLDRKLDASLRYAEGAVLDAIASGDADLIRQRQEELQALHCVKDGVLSLFASPFETVTQAALDQVFLGCGPIPDWAEADIRGLYQLLNQMLADELGARTGKIQSIKDDAIAQANSIFDQARSAGYDDTDMTQFDVPSEDVGDVDIPPDEDPVDPYDEDSDPYAAEADAVIADLAATTDGVGVVFRQEFLTLVAGWRTRSAIISEVLLNSPSPSPAELDSFIRASDRVSAFIDQYLDELGWFRDNKVPLATREAIQEVMQVPYLQVRAQQLKESLNSFPADLTPQQEHFLGVLTVVLEGIRYAHLYSAAVATAKAQQMTYSWFDATVEVAAQLALFGVLLSPAGDFIDLCELVTGRELCIPGGRELQTWERALSAGGLVLGTGLFWREVGKRFGSLFGELAEWETKLAKYDPQHAAEMVMRMDRLGPYSYEFFRYVDAETLEWVLDNYDDIKLADRMLPPALCSYFYALERAYKYGFDSYRSLKTITGGWGDAWNVHHIIEERFKFNPQIREVLGEDPRDWLAVIVKATPEEHQKFTNRWKDLIPKFDPNDPLAFSTRTATADEIWAAAELVYRDYPEILVALDKRYGRWKSHTP